MCPYRPRRLAGNLMLLLTMLTFGCSSKPEASRCRAPSRRT